MRLEYYPPDKLKREVLEIIGRHLDLQKYLVFFFGSRVAGIGPDHSEINLGIDGSETIPSEKMTLIERKIESIPTLYKIEVADFKKLPQYFRDIGFRHTESLILD